VGYHLLILYTLMDVVISRLIPSISALLSRYTSPGEEGLVYGLDNSIQAGACDLASLLCSGAAMWINLHQLHFHYIDSRLGWFGDHAAFT
jgi:hypothetical protein